MRLNELITTRPWTLSFEFSPPRSSKATTIWQDAVAQLVELAPDFFSVTYGAGGSTRSGTLDSVSHIINKHQLPAMAHLTCVGNSKDELRALFDEYHAAGIDNFLALRGDPPKGSDSFVAPEDGCTYAADLLDLLAEDGRFGTACAAFPEGHPEAPDRQSDWQHLADKLRRQPAMAITQAFWDASCYKELLSWLNDQGLGNIRIVPGILCPRSWAWVQNFVSKYCPSATLPKALQDCLEPLADNAAASRQAGIAYTVQLCKDLLDAGAPGLHFYTLNKANPTAEIVTALRLQGYLTETGQASPAAPASVSN